MQKCCDYLKNGKKRYRPFINGYLHRHQAKEIVYRKKKTITELLSITLFLFPEVNWNEPENEATTWKRGRMPWKMFFWTYEKVLPYLSFCYLHSLRNPNTNARAGGAHLNLFSFHHLCIWFRSVVVITSALRRRSPVRAWPKPFFSFFIFLFLHWKARTMFGRPICVSFFWGRTQLEKNSSFLL